MFSRHRLGLLSVVLAVAAVSPVGAAELDKFLPADTEVFVRINVRHALDSNLVKKLGIEQVRDLIKQVEELDTAFKELEFDPLRDIDSVTVAAPSGNEPDRMLVILHGKFKLAKFKAKGEDLAKDMGDVVKLHKIADGTGGQVNLYEITPPGQDLPLFVALPNDTTMLVSPGKDYVADAIKREKAKGPLVLKKKDFQALLEKMDPKQTLALAAIGEALTKSADAGDVKDALAKIDALGGGITLGDDIKVEIIVGARTAQEAKELKGTIDDGVTKGLTLVGLLALNNKDFAPLADVLKAIRCSAKEKTVVIKAEIGGEVIESLKKLIGN